MSRVHFSAGKQNHLVIALLSTLCFSLNALAADDIKQEVKASPKVTEELKRVAPHYDSLNNETRLTARTAVAKLVVGRLTPVLENRLGDFSEEELTKHAEEILRKHQEFVADLRKFSTMDKSVKDERKAVIAALKEQPDLLSARDVQDIDHERDELNWSDNEIKTRLANALVMLGFNHHYFHGLKDQEPIVASLREAMATDPAIVKDTMFLQVAKKGIAQTDAEFMVAYKKITRTEFAPAAVAD